MALTSEAVAERDRPELPKSPAFFTFDGQSYHPTPLATSHWAPTMLTGPATCGLIARAIEQSGQSDGFRPARLTIDLYKPVPVSALKVATTSSRTSKRIRVFDAALLDTNGELCARATAIFLRSTAPPDGEVWQRPASPPAPPPDHPELLKATSVPLFGSDGHSDGWSVAMHEHQGSARKRMWSRNIAVVAGEDPSPFTVAAIVAEATSLATNWGTEGVNYINADVTLTLGRLPKGREIGIEADNHTSSAGIASCAGTLYDREGPLGTAVVVALANARRGIDLSAKRRS